MADDRPRLRKSITWERGLNEIFEPSMLPDGAASELINWEASPTGELRARAGWLLGDTGSAPGTRKGVGIGYFSRVIIPGIVQRTTATNTGATSITVTWPNTTLNGNLLILVVSYTESGAGSCTASTPSGWTQAVARNSGNQVSAIYYKANASAQSGDVTATVTPGSSPETMCAHLLEVSGIALSSPLDKTSSQQTTSATLDTTATAATTQAVEFVIASLDDTRLENQSSPTNSFQLIVQTQVDGSGGDLTNGLYFKTTTATDTQQCQATTSTSDAFSAVIATFKGWFTSTPSAGQTSVTRWIVAQNDTTEYDIFTHDRQDLTTGGWTNVASISATDPTSLVGMAPGMGKTWITNQQLSSPYYYDGVSVTAIPTSSTSFTPRGGRAIAVHKNRVWVAGTNGAPGRLYFSNIGDGLTWGSLDYIDISAEDGEPIEDITPQGNELVIGKRTGLWVLSGSGLDNFVLTKLSIGGLAPGRTLMPTPYGTVAAGRATIWLVNGSDVQRISGPISESYLYTSGTLTSSFIDDNYYVCDGATGRIFVLNMQTGTWRFEELDTNNFAGQIYNHDFTQVFAPYNATTASLLNYRDFPTVIKRKDFDTLTESYTAATALIFPVGPEEAFTPRHLYVRYRQHVAGAGQANLVVTPTYRKQDGTTTTGTVHNVAPKATAAVFRDRMDLGNVSGVSGVQFRFTQALGTTDDCVMDIEEITFEFDVERIR